MSEINIANLWTRAYKFVYGSIRIISFVFKILAENIEMSFAKMFILINPTNIHQHSEIFLSKNN